MVHGGLDPGKERCSLIGQTSGAGPQCDVFRAARALGRRHRRHDNWARWRHRNALGHLLQPVELLVVNVHGTL